MSGSVSTRVSQIESVYATTGSNSFRATQSITGSLTVTGQIIAQTLNVQQVTSSIVFSSGSNTFGCDLNSRQTFTGSVLMTGSLIVNTTGPELQVNNNGVVLGNLLTDNHSITGSLRVTGSATFASTITAAGLKTNGGGTFAQGELEFTSTTSAGQLGIFTNQPSSTTLFFDHRATSNTGNFLFRNGSGGANTLMYISGNGNVGIGITPSYKLDVNRGSSGVVLNLEGTNAYDAETGILMSAGRAKISGFLNNSGGTPGTSLRFYTMPDEGSVTERMRISSTGNVGIGTTGNPNTIFQVLSSSNNNTTTVEGQTRLFNTFDGGVATIGFSSNSGGNQDGRAGIAAGKDPISGTTGFLAFSVRKDAGSFIEAMRITSAGRVGIGVTNPESLLDVTDSSSNTLMLVKNTSTANTTGKNAMYGFGGTDTVGTPKAVGGMQAVPNDVNWVNGLLYWYVRAGDGQALRMSLSSSGALVISGALTQNGSPSDINLKQNLVKISSPLEKISQINGYNFEWKEGSPARGNISNIVEDAGVIAQEIEQVMPEIVRTSDDNKVVNYNGLVGLLIEGMKAQQCTINALKSCLGIA